MLQGSCLCGAVAYESGPLATPIGLCHCRTCQKAHASAYAATARTARADFRWTRGGDLVAAFASTPGKKRWFCPRCGTHLMAEWTDQDQVILRVGSLDTLLDQRPVVHIWMADATPMLEPPAGLPMFEKGR
ncbi:MAG: aldehyde-activating protein [Alphaproteobacteria bacterium]|nr:aldehyde-activating protein [Alphaproteobacteria bacterium]